jgi:aspartate/methionine/tyrosine aminotransferase
MKPNLKIHRPEKLEPFKLERYFAKHEFTARFLASSSDAETISLKELLAFEKGTLEDLLETRLGYSDSNGIPKLRTAIAEHYETIGAHQVITHTGAQEPIFNFFHSLFQSGDHVIVHIPAYQSLYSVPKSLGCEVTPWAGTFENGWKPDLSELEKLLRPETQAVIVNTPHNPTGFLFSREDQKKLIELLKSRGILLFSDEVYRGIERNPENRLPAACDLYENAVSLGVLSKAHGLPGLRVGWVATRNEEVLKRMASQKDYSTICNSILVEKLAAVAIRHQDRLISRNREIVETNWKHAKAFFDKHRERFECVPPQGGTMVFPRAKAGFNLPRFIQSLIEEHGIMIVGGEHFDMPENYFRLGLGRKDFAEVLSQIDSACSAL